MMSEHFLPMDKEKCEVVTCNDDAKKKTKVYQAEFDSKNTPLSLRNYIAVSKSENFDKEFFVENEFYVSSVKAMYIGHALGKNTKAKNDNGEYIYEQPYRKNTSFYILHYDVTKVEGLRNDKYCTKKQ